MAPENSVSPKEKALALPHSPGVYQFVDRQGEIIYVGKAKDLKRRVSSYFVDSAAHPPKVRILVRQIADIRHILVSSESDALLLENNIIKRLKPRYNLLLKDDKTYPWIVVRAEDFPRIESTRKVVRDGSRYFGPYASGLMQKEVLELIHSLYPIRTCKLNLSPEAIARGRYSVCLQYHIGNCKGPCVGLQSSEEYEADIRLVASMLGGDWRDTKRHLESVMNEAAAALRFEEAERAHQRLAILEKYTSKSVIVNNSQFTLDVFVIVIDAGVGYADFVRIFRGAVVSSFTAQLNLGAEEDRTTILTQALSQLSERIPGGLAREVAVEWLPEESLFPGVTFTVPRRGDKLKLLEFAQRGARLFRLEMLKNLEIKDPARHTDRILEVLRQAFHLASPPRHIECFDNSNLQGTHPVAACVVFRDAKPSPKEYRHYNVKTVVGADDFATMREIVGRRLARLVDEGAELPDLIVVDGGKGQLSAAYGVLREMGLEKKVPIVGLAKRIEEIFFPGDPDPYYLDRNSEALRVMMHIRDEAHRFGITFHRQKRSKDFIKSELDAIPGVGPGSVAKLLRKFRSVAAVRRAPVEDIAQVVGKQRAMAIRAHFDGAPVDK